MHGIPWILLAALAPGAERVAKVVVYPERAQVTRVARINCAERATVVFDGLPPAAEESSLRALAMGAEVLAVRASAIDRREAFSARAADLDRQAIALEAQAVSLRDRRAQAAQSARAAHGYAELSAALVAREMSLGNLDIENWGAAVDLALREQLDAAAESAAAESALGEVGKRAAEVERAQEEGAAAAPRRQLRAEVLVRCAAPAVAEVALSYLVAGASWSPAYEAHAEEGAVDLSIFATVRQTTGENWSGAQLSLSTAEALQDSTPPQLAPLLITAHERGARPRELAQRTQAVAHVDARAASAPAAERKTGLRASTQGASVQLSVQGPADVSGDGAPARLFVGAYRLAARYSLRTAPKAAPVIFRAAELVNDTPFALLPGPLDAFAHHGLTARSRLARVAQGEPFKLSFGLEERVRVRRKVLEEAARDTGLFGSDHRLDFAYRFELQSHLSEAAVIELTDHLPVSELADVEVELDEGTTPGGKLTQDGLVTFPVKLEPGETRKLELKFHIHVPPRYALSKR
jgi:uncharacterized protein (TIGR02231 family)